MMFPEMKSQKVRCKDCQHCNPVVGMGNICGVQPTSDKRYKTGYKKVYPTKEHFCSKFIKL